MTAEESARIEERPKVSVCVVTYNQRDYIAECLESIVTQQTDFPFEVIVGDDASTDGTTDIVRDYAARYPHLIRLMLHEKNLGPFENYRVVHRAARGEYVAHIDGDDVMLRGKLAQQESVLNKNPDLSSVFHILKMISADGKDSGRLWPSNSPEVIDIDFLIRNHPIIGHSSMMYRAGLIDDIINGQFDFVDFLIFVKLTSFGKIGFLESVLGKYRVGVGVSSNNKWLKLSLNAIECAKTAGASEDVAKEAATNQIFRASRKALLSKNFKEFKILIEDSYNFCETSNVQYIFFKFRNFPFILRMVNIFYTKLVEMKIIPDIYMRSLK